MTRLNAIALAALAVSALAANGCGGKSTATNGLDQMPATKVQRMAAAALATAPSAHVKGTTAAGRTTMDLRFDGSSIRGTLATGGAKVAIVRIGDVPYVNADRGGLKVFGASPASQRAGAGRWLKLGMGQITEWKGLSLAELAGQLTHNTSPLEPGVSKATLDGKPVVVLRYRDGSRLFVAATGPAYPLRGDYGGAAAGRVEFSEFGADFHITAPPGAVDVAQLPDRG